MTIRVTVAMKSIDGDKVIEVDAALNATLMMRRVAYLLQYQVLFPNWQYASWLWQGQTQYLYKEAV